MHKGNAMNSKGFLLATAAGAAFAPVAQAADLPVRKAPGYVDPPASWAGWYIGGHIGANWQQAHNDNTYAPYHATSTGTGFIGGGQLGINWQRGNFVFGIEADGSWLSGGGSIARDSNGYSASNKVRWLATVRPRFGLAVGDTMVYTTAGVAFGGVRNSNTIDTGVLGTKSESKTRVGWVVGGGIEHMLNRKWTIGLEGLFVDLGRSSVSVPSAFSTPKTTRFANQAVIGRLKLNYKW